MVYLKFKCNQATCVLPGNPGLEGSDQVSAHRPRIVLCGGGHVSL